MHEPYERLVPGAESAVLFIHGILSTPRFWDGFVSALPGDVSVVSLLLPGHGGTVRDFGRVRRGAWRQHVHEAILRLKETHARVYLVGHSMGALLSILEAVDNPSDIAGLLLMAVSALALVVVWLGAFTPAAMAQAWRAASGRPVRGFPDDPA